MNNEDSRRLDMLCFDESTETWFVDTRDTQRLPLSRGTIDGLVQLYNSVHRGSPLLLSDSKALRRLEENNRRLSETIRDLYLHIDREQQRRPFRILARLAARAAGLLRRRPRRS